MKKLFSALILSAFFFSSSAFALDVWQVRSSSEADPLFTSVHFPTFDNGWVVGYGGKIFVTSDQGDNWAVQTSPTTKNLNSVYFVSALRGYAVGESGTLLRYEAGTWTDFSSYFPSNADLSSVCFYDVNNGWVVADSSSSQNLFVTSNGGYTWTSYEVGVTGDGSSATYLTKVLYTGFGSGWAVGSNDLGSGEVFRLSSGGSVWQCMLTASNEAFTCADFLDANNGAVAGWRTDTGGSVYYVTGNGGTSWNRQPYGTPIDGVLNLSDRTPCDVELIGSDFWIAAEDRIFQYSNGTWLGGDIGAAVFTDIHFQSVDNGWGVGGVPTSEGTFRFVMKYVTDPSGLLTEPAGFYTANQSYHVNFSIYGNNILRNSTVTFETVPGVTFEGSSVVADAYYQRYRINASMEVGTTSEVEERAYRFYVTNPNTNPAYITTTSGLITFEVAPSFQTPQARQTLPVLVQTGSWNPSSGGKEIKVISKGKVFSQGKMSTLGISALAAEADLELIVYRFANRQIAYRKKFRADPSGYTTLTLNKITDLGLDISEGVYSAVVIHPTQGIIGRSTLAVHYTN